jgi:acyl carrier protein
VNRDEALLLVQRILSDKLGIEPDAVVPAAHLRDDLALDSLDAVDLVASLEEEFGERLDPNEVGDLSTVGEVLDLIQRRSSARAAP